jgi:hypothetical protein
MKKVIRNGVPSLCIFALRQFKAGHEIRYDYGPDKEHVMAWRYQLQAVAKKHEKSNDATAIQPQVRVRADGGERIAFESAGDLRVAAPDTVRTVERTESDAVESAFPSTESRNSASERHSTENAESSDRSGPAMAETGSSHDSLLAVIQSEETAVAVGDLKESNCQAEVAELSECMAIQSEARISDDGSERLAFESAGDLRVAAPDTVRTVERTESDAVESAFPSTESRNSASERHSTENAESSDRSGPAMAETGSSHDSLLAVIQSEETAVAVGDLKKGNCQAEAAELSEYTAIGPVARISEDCCEQTYGYYTESADMEDSRSDYVENSCSSSGNSARYEGYFSALIPKVISTDDIFEYSDTENDSTVYNRKVVCDVKNVTEVSKKSTGNRVFRKVTMKAVKKVQRGLHYSSVQHEDTEKEDENDEDEIEHEDGNNEDDSENSGGEKERVSNCGKKTQHCVYSPERKVTAGQRVNLDTDDSEGKSVTEVSKKSTGNRVFRKVTMKPVKKVQRGLHYSSVQHEDTEKEDENDEDEIEHEDGNNEDDSENSGGEKERVSNCGKKARHSVHIQKKKAVLPSTKIVYDKVHYCTFCNAAIKDKIAKHLLRHRDEEQIKAIQILPKRSKERIRLLGKLASEGNFKHNISVLQTGKGNLVVGRRSELQSSSTTGYTACSFCKKWLTKHNLSRHTKKCKEFIAHHQRSSQKNEPKVLAVKRGKALVENSVFSGDQQDLSELVKRMQDDDIKDIALADDLIIREAGLRLSALGRKEDQKQDDIYRVSQTARMLARIVQQARLTKPGITLSELLVPSNFDFVVKIAKKMSTDKDKPALNVGRSIGMLLTKVCLSKHCSAIRDNHPRNQADATNFSKLIQTEWNSRVNRTAMRRIQTEKRNKLNPIPVTEDLQKFRTFLISIIRDSSERLMHKKINPEDWVILSKATMSRLILFNKRRRAEVRELKIDEYLNRPNWRDDDCGEMAMALSPMDRLLANR